MANFHKSKILNYSAKQIVDLVLDIEKYPQFLPWCKDAKIIKIINPNLLNAYLVVNFKAISQKYVSRVEFYEEKSPQDINKTYYIIDVKAIEGPFKKLNSRWRIIDIKDPQHNIGGSCKVDFYIDFEFSSFVLQKMIGTMFGYASEKMINSFEERAKKVYNKANLIL